MRIFTDYPFLFTQVVEVVEVVVVVVVATNATTDMTKVEIRLRGKSFLSYPTFEKELTAFYVCLG